MSEEDNNNIDRYFYRKQIMKSARKKTIQPIKNSVDSKNNPTIQLIKLDIQSIQDYIKLYENEINIYNTPEKKIILDSKLNLQLTKIKESLNIDLITYYSEINKSCLNITNLYKEYGVEDKDELIKQMASVNGLLYLFLDKLKDLFFLINLSYSNQQNSFIGSEEYSDNNSKFLYIKYHLDKFKQMINNENNKFNDSLFSPNFNISGYSNMNDDSLLDKLHHNNRNIMNNNADLIRMSSSSSNNEFISKVSSMKTFNEFLNYNDEVDNNFNTALDKIRFLFYNDNEKVFNLFMDFIPNKIKDKLPQLSKIVSVINSKEYYNMLECVSTIRKVLEDYIEELNSTINTNKKEIENLSFQIKNLENENEKLNKNYDILINKDLKKFLLEIKNENSEFLKIVPELSKQSIMKITNELLERNERYFELEKICNGYKTEIICLKKDIDFYHINGKKKGDELCDALKVQIEEMKEGFMEDMKDLKDSYSKEKIQYIKQIKFLENDKQCAKDLSKLLSKRLNDIEKIFSLS